MGCVPNWVPGYRLVCVWDGGWEGVERVVGVRVRLRAAHGPLRIHGRRAVDGEEAEVRVVGREAWRD